jgi:hypothetical protein
MGVGEETGKTPPLFLWTLINQYMEKVKVFVNFFEYEETGDAKEIQTKINSWLEKNPDYKIKNITSSLTADSDGDLAHIVIVNYLVDPDFMP